MYIKELKAGLTYHLLLHPGVGCKVEGLCLQGLEMLQTLSAAPGHMPRSRVLFAWGVPPTSDAQLGAPWAGLSSVAAWVLPLSPCLFLAALSPGNGPAG